MGGEGVLGFVVTAFSRFWFGFGLVGCRDHVGPLGWMLWLAAVCLGISVWMSQDLRWDCSVSFWEVNMASYLLWAGQSLNQNLNSKCVVCMKLFMTLDHF